MKKRIFVVCVVVFGLVAAAGLFAQAGYTGPGSSPASGAQGGYTGPGSGPAAGTVVTAAAAKELRDDARVTLQGTIVNQLSREKYTFRDASGEIVVEIDRKRWGTLSLGANDRVEIYGEVDRERRGTVIEIDVKTMRKL